MVLASHLLLEDLSNYAIFCTLVISIWITNMKKNCKCWWFNLHVQWWEIWTWSVQMTVDMTFASGLNVHQKSVNWLICELNYISVEWWPIIDHFAHSILFFFSFQEKTNQERKKEKKTNIKKLLKKSKYLWFLNTFRVAYVKQYNQFCKICAKLHQFW